MRYHTESVPRSRICTRQALEKVNMLNFVLKPNIKHDKNRWKIYDQNKVHIRTCSNKESKIISQNIYWLWGVLTAMISWFYQVFFINQFWKWSLFDINVAPFTQIFFLKIVMIMEDFFCQICAIPFDRFSLRLKDAEGVTFLAAAAWLRSLSRRRWNVMKFHIIHACRMQTPARQLILGKKNMKILSNL